MSRRRGDKSRTPVLFSLLRDPWRKLASIGLGILLWFYLNNQITNSESDIRLALSFQESAHSQQDLTIKLNSGDYGLKQFVDGIEHNPISGVMIDISGPNREVQQLEKQLEFVVEVAPSEVQTGGAQPFIVFRKENIRHKHDRRFDGFIISMSPNTVIVELEPNDQKSLLLGRSNIEIQIADADLAKRLKVAEFQPTNIPVSGPAAEIQKIADDTLLFLAEVTSNANTERVSAELKLLPQFKQLGISAQTAHVIFDVEPEHVRFTLKDVPVHLDTGRVDLDANSPRFEVSPKNMNVVIEVAKSSELYRTHLQDFVKIGERDQNDAPHEVDPSWSRTRARLRVYLRPDDVSAEVISPRQPWLELFDVNLFDHQTIFQRGHDFEDLDQGRRQIDIKRTPADKKG